MDPLPSPPLFKDRYRCTFTHFSGCSLARLLRNSTRTLEFKRRYLPHSKLADQSGASIGEERSRRNQTASVLLDDSVPRSAPEDGLLCSDHTLRHRHVQLRLDRRKQTHVSRGATRRHTWERLSRACIFWVHVQAFLRRERTRDRHENARCDERRRQTSVRLISFELSIHMIVQFARFLFCSYMYLVIRFLSQIYLFGLCFFFLLRSAQLSYDIIFYAMMYCVDYAYILGVCPYTYNIRTDCSWVRFTVDFLYDHDGTTQ